MIYTHKHVGEAYEGSTVVIPIVFYAETSEAITPTTAEFRVDNEDGTSVMPLTSFTTEIIIPADKNMLVVQSKDSERRTISLRWTYAGKAGTGMFTYDVIGLTYI